MTPESRSELHDQETFLDLTHLETASGGAVTQTPTIRVNKDWVTSRVQLSVIKVRVQQVNVYSSKLS